MDHGTTLACSCFYPLIVKTLEAWVELPHLQSCPAPPSSHHGLLTDAGLEDFNPTTIYSVPELRDLDNCLVSPPSSSPDWLKSYWVTAATKMNAPYQLLWDRMTLRVLT